MSLRGRGFQPTGLIRLRKEFQLGCKRPSDFHIEKCTSAAACLLAAGCILVIAARGLLALQPISPLNYGRPIHDLVGASKIDCSLVSLKIEKSRFLLTVLYRGRPLKSYPVVLGTNPVDDKLCEGDNCTPEGEFKIVDMRSPHKWSRFMLLNYPTTASRTRFLAARKRGEVRAEATIGGAIGIHGVPKGFDKAIDAHENWTAGCIALKTADIDEIYSVCRRGTAVRIVH